MNCNDDDTRSKLIAQLSPGQAPARAPSYDPHRDIDEILHRIKIVDRWLDEAAPPAYKDNPLANMWRRISAGPVSEAAESVDAANGMTGGNPRKGVTHTQHDLLGELADTAVSALLAIQSQTKDIRLTWRFFLTALAKGYQRVPEDQR